MLILVSILILDMEFHLMYVELFHWQMMGLVRMYKILGTDVSPFMLTDDKKKILVLVFEQRLDDTTLTAQAE